MEIKNKQSISDSVDRIQELLNLEITKENVQEIDKRTRIIKFR